MAIVSRLPYDLLWLFPTLLILRQSEIWMTRNRLVLFLIIAIVGGTVRVSAQTTTGPYSLLRRDAAVPEGTVATIDGNPISLSELDPRFAAALKGLEATERKERKRVFEEAVSQELFALEGRARRVSATEVVAQEVQSRLRPSTPVEIRQIYDEHLSEFGGAPLDAVKDQIVVYLKEKQTDSILSGLAQRLRTKFPVQLGVDINSPALTPTATIATIAGKPMLGSALIERMKPVSYQIRSQLYTAVRAALNQLLYARLIIAESRRRGIEPETIVRSEITEKTLPINETDVTRFYNDNIGYFSEHHFTLDAARPTIYNQLETEGRARLEADLAARLRKDHPVVEYLVEPEVPVLSISVDDDPSRGDVNAAVTVVMFTDFQCPTCAKTHPILQDLLKQYGNRVHFVVRDFPLNIHPDAAKAAEAANAAHAQGKFFEYIDLLYRNQNALSVPKLKEYATQIGLDRAKFDLALAQGTYLKEVLHDLEDGGVYGINGTPSIFINGRKVIDISATGLQQALDRAFAEAAPAKPANR